MQQLWMVDRTYDDKGMVRVTYATLDGEGMFRKEFAEQRLFHRGHEVTAAVEIDPERVRETSRENVEGFAAEATRMAETHDPDDPI